MNSAHLEEMGRINQQGALRNTHDLALTTFQKEMNLLKKDYSPIVSIRRSVQAQLASIKKFHSGEIDMMPLPPQIDHLGQLMNAAQLRHGVISNNLANVNTPGYERLDVQFEELLAEHLKSGNPTTSNGPAPQVFKEKGLNVRSDGNNVDIDREIGQLNRNAMLFQTYSQIVGSQFDIMRRATSR